ncbi:T9SS type A sorting domain-containing protein [Lewinella sp. W8]|uniref:T9SS type A sorting domain-containing protein n=1 Tax=Lewinella sp. W8 TaxID=2528208 RepID=UPI0010688D4E|nr:T9SS type A sorting domain-containing protein [Lewinella sp. W8]MTB50361.1 T9SS type A sorting domain-containing protein [Lewinella sp. W8]
MHKKITFLLLTLLTGAGLWAQAASDGFDYPASATLAGNGAAGDGWSSGWVATSDADTSLVATGGVLNETLLARTSNNRAVIVSTGPQNRYQRYFTAPITSATGDFWFSVHLAVEGTSLANAATLSLVDTTDNSERVTFGKRFGNRNVFATGAGAGATNSGLQFQGTDARWLVGHMTFDTDNDQWLLDLWVDTDPAAEPQEADAQIMNKAYANRPFHAIQLKAEGGAGVDLSVDDLYFGSTFAEVVPSDLISIGEFSPGATEKFAYEVGDSLTQVGAGGTGWDGDWMLRAGLSPVMEATGITSDILQRQTSGTNATVSTSTRVVRRLDGQYGDVGRTFWIGYWFQTVNAGGNVSHFVLADEAALADSGGGGRLAQIGSGFNNPNIAIVQGGPQSGTGISSAEARFVVLEVVTNGTAANDEIYVYIDPDLDAPPSREDANAVGLRNLSDWNAIALLQEGGPGVTSRWDDILVGDAFADVVPDDLIDTSIPQTAIAFEQFNYATGDEVVGSGEAEDGWAGAWDTIATDTTFAVINSGGLVNENLLARTSSNSYAATSAGEPNRVIRYLETPITQENNGTVWFSTHMAVSGNVGNNVGTLVFADTTQDNYERIIIGKRFGNRNLFATGGGVGANNSGALFEGNSARWVVGRLVASDTSDQWILNVWVDPSPAEMPADTNANIANKLYPTATIHGVSLKAEGAAGLIFTADDIFIGQTFADVVPADFEVVPEAPAGAMETFDYAMVDSINGQTGGSGWDGAWTLVADGNQPITEGGVENFNLLKQTSGNKVSFTANGVVARRLAGTYGDQGRTTWVGFWFDSENGGPNVTNLVLADFDQLPVGAPGELLQVGRSFNGSNLRIIGQGTSDASASEGHFVVLELDTDGTSANDAVYMWVDPDLNAAPSRDTADVVGSANLTNWDAIALKVAGNPGVTAVWDDIYLGASFADIVPNDLLDIQNPTEPVVATEPFDYPAGEDLNEQNGGTGWLSGWEQIDGSITLAEGSIASDRVDATGNKASVSQVGDAVTYERPYFARFAEDSPAKSTVWMTFLTDVTESGIGNNGGISLVDGDTPVLTIGRTGGTTNLAVTYNGASQASPVQTFNGTNWVVVQLDIYGAGVADTARIWVNPLSDVLPDPEEAVFTLTDLAIENGFDRLRISAAGATQLDFFADEIYTGFSFRDVSPNFGSDDPALLAYEPFNYDAGLSLFGTGGINAFWDGVWTDASGAGEVNEVTITEGSIDLPDLEEVGNKVEFGFFESGRNIRADRKLAFPLLSDGRTYWMTFLMNTLEPDALDNVANVTFRSSGIAANGGQRLSVGRQFGDGLLGFVTPPSGNSRRSEVMDEGLHWLVFRVQTAADGAPDSVAMWIDPPLNVEPDTSTAFNYGLTTVFDGAPIDIIRIRVDGDGANQTPYVTTFDELRIATEWQSARLTTNVIEPEEDDVFYLGAYPNPFGEELNVTFQAPRSGRYDLQLFDLNGREVSRIFSGELPVGEQQLRWNNTGLANGVYFLRIVHGNQSTVRKLILYR